jgi:hypothetical protein
MTYSTESLDGTGDHGISSFLEDGALVFSSGRKKTARERNEAACGRKRMCQRDEGI